VPPARHGHDLPWRHLGSLFSGLAEPLLGPELVNLGPSLLIEFLDTGDTKRTKMSLQFLLQGLKPCLHMRQLLCCLLPNPLARSYNEILTKEVMSEIVTRLDRLFKRLDHALGPVGLSLQPPDELTQRGPIPFRDPVKRLALAHARFDAPGQEPPQSHLEYLELVHDLAVSAIHDELIDPLVRYFGLRHTKML
jgi:hypothetical protein